MKILVVRYSSIGDIVLTTPVMRLLKQLEGEVVVHYLTKKPFEPLVENNPNVDRVITIQKHVSEVSKTLLDEAYDYVIDLHNNIRSRQAKRAAKSLNFTVDKRNWAKWLYVQTKREVLPIGHFTDRCIATLSAFGISNDGKGLDLYLPDNAAVNDVPTTHRGGFVAYAIGGQKAGKILPTEKIIALCKKIEQPIALLGGPEDKAAGDAIATACGDRAWNAAGAYTLMQSAWLLQQATCVLTHDTGLMHMAAALNKKVISLWFATTPQLGFAPWRPAAGSVMIEADCKKRPTSKLGNRGYRDGCVFNIDLEEVAGVVNQA